MLVAYRLAGLSALVTTIAYDGGAAQFRRVQSGAG
jgi:hypothetical protein